MYRNPQPLTGQKIEELPGLQLRSGEDQFKVSRALWCCCVRLGGGGWLGFFGYRQISILVELFRRHARPLAVHLAALDRSAEDKHDIGMAVIGATGSVLLLRVRPNSDYGHQHNVLGLGAAYGLFQKAEMPSLKLSSTFANCQFTLP